MSNFYFHYGFLPFIEILEPKTKISKNAFKLLFLAKINSILLKHVDPVKAPQGGGLCMSAVTRVV